MIDHDSHCVGCMACANICPQHAISVRNDPAGFLYPTVDVNGCVNCGLCESVCLLKNPPLSFPNEYGYGYSNDTDRLHESSGGVFGSIAKYIINNGGIVFGASFDSDFNVIIKSVDTIDRLQDLYGAKYVQADTKNTFTECKHYLDNGKVVLYSGTPCQIHALKMFLRKPYSNLYTIDIVCHGVPSPDAWKKYKYSISELVGRTIKSVDFRDKTHGWQNYHIKVTFTDGSVIDESHYDNNYMKLFLSDTMLRNSCYGCKLKNNNCSDITLGDFWGVHLYNIKHDDKGLNVITCHTSNACKLLSNANVNFTPLTDKINALKSLMYNTQLTAKVPASYTLMYTKKVPKVAILTHSLHTNCGGILQAWALQNTLNTKCGCDAILVNQVNELTRDRFVDEKCKCVSTNVDSSYNAVVVGSDIVWNKNSRYAMNCSFDHIWMGAYNYPIHKVVYAASTGDHTLCNFDDSERAKITKNINKCKWLSCREIMTPFFMKEWFGINVTPVLDPTMLHSANEYVQLIDDTLCADPNGVFAYILDQNAESDKFIRTMCETMNSTVLPFDNTVRKFIDCMNHCKYVVTDSFHGCVFALIFNKPFVCVVNRKRGADRFDSLKIQFRLNNMFETYQMINLDCLNTAPNKISLVNHYARKSLSWLYQALFM